MKGYIQSSPAISGDIVIVGGDNLTARNKDTGTVLWEWQADVEIDLPGGGPLEFSAVCATPAISGDIVVWGTRSPGYILASDLDDGDIIWAKDLGTWVGFCSPAVSGDTVFVAAENDMIALDISSGITGDIGEMSEVAIEADHTLGIALPKTGYFIGEGARH